MKHIFAGLVIALFGFLSEAQAEETANKAIKIGCLYPTTGPAGLYGRDSTVAIQMALDHVQDTYGDDAPQLDVMIEDTRSRSLRSLQIARAFIHEEAIDFLCGVLSSDIALLVAIEAAKAETFFIGAGHASPSVILHERHPFYFRANNGSRQSMFAGAQYIKENHSRADRPLKIAFIGPDYELGYQAWGDLRGFLNQQGVAFDVVGEYWPKLFETDYNSHIRHLLQGDVDIIINAHWGLDFVAFVRQAAQLGLFSKAVVMNFDGAGDFGVLGPLGDELPEGLVLSAHSHVNWPETAEHTAFVQEFHDRAGRYPSFVAQDAYAGILAIAQAVHVAGGVADKQRLRHAFETLKIKLPEDPEGFESFMDPVSHQLMQVQAIGVTRRDTSYPPAGTTLGDWHIYMPPKHWPTHEPDSSKN